VRGWLYVPGPLSNIVKWSRDVGRLSEWSGASMMDVSVSEVSDCGQTECRCERDMESRPHGSLQPSSSVCK